MGRASERLNGKSEREEAMTPMLRNLRMKQKLLISYILVVLLPVLTVGIILTKGMNDMALDQAENSMSDNVDQIIRSLSQTFTLGNDMSKKIYLDDVLMYILSKRYTSSVEMVNDYQNYRLLDEELTLYPQEINDIRLYAFNSSLLNNSRIIPLSEEMKSYGWYSQAITDDGKISWGYNYNEIDGKMHVSLTRLFKNTNGRPLGILIIEIKDQYLNSILSDVGFTAAVIDYQGNIVATNERALLVRNESALDIDADKNSRNIVYQGKPSIMIEKTFLPETGAKSFRIVSIFSTAAIMSKTRDTFFLGFTIMTASLFAALLLIFVFSNALSKRVSQLSRDIHLVAQGDFNIPLNIQGRDEIGQLSQDLQYMIHCIEDLIHEVYDANLQKKQLEIQQKEIKLKILANQMNPHFMFNVLETIRSKANRAGAMEIVQIVKLLGKILRNNLELNCDSVLLSEELELVRSYLELQKYRYGDKIDYRIDAEDGLGGYKILPMIIQPIVENSVIHGLEKKLEAGAIRIGVQKADGALIITVSDNGLGIDEARLRAMRDSLDRHGYDPGVGIGLRNVSQRIALRYGSPFGLWVTSKTDVGTEVTLRLPEGGDSNAESSDCG